MSYKILEIEGIGAVKQEALAKANIATTDDLLEACKSPSGRKATAASTGIDESDLLKFANMADLMRIKGVGSEYSELLEAAGVDTVKELKMRNPENLHAKIVEVENQKDLVRRVPSLAEVTDWIEQAKTMPAVLSY